MLLDMPVDVEGEPEKVLFPGVVPKLGQQPGRVRWLGPELGEHTADVLADLLELSNAEIAALRDRKVV
jgi:formyl-CoA transferase